MEIELQPPLAPIATLNDTDKMYFAVERYDVDRRPYVRTLVSNRMGKTNSYDLIPHTEVSVFHTAPAADYYVSLVRQIISIQERKFPAYRAFCNAVSKEIAAFNSHTR